MGMREQFEAWVSTSMDAETRNLLLQRHSLPDLPYVDKEIQGKWLAWQAATETALTDVSASLLKQGYEADPGDPSDVYAALFDLICDFQKAEHGARRYRFLRAQENAQSGAPFIGVYTGALSMWNGEEADRLVDEAIRSREG